jgi:hypothetical protein
VLARSLFHYEIVETDDIIIPADLLDFDPTIILSEEESNLLRGASQIRNDQDIRKSP